MREATVQEKILKEVSAQCPGIVIRVNAGKAWGGKREWSNYHGCYIIKDPKPVRLAPKGFSDVVYFGPKKETVFIEIKNEKGETSPEQNRFLTLMRKMGYRCIVARSAEEAVSFINGGGDTGGPGPI